MWNLKEERESEAKQVTRVKKKKSTEGVKEEKTKRKEKKILLLIFIYLFMKSSIKSPGIEKMWEDISKATAFIITLL